MTTPTEASEKYPIVVSPRHHHFFRTLFASLFGSLALSLVFASILVVWVNRTFTETNTYVRTVSPLIAQPAIQDFLADKVTNTLVKTAPPVELVSTVLPPAETAGKTAEQLLPVAKLAINDSVLQVVRSAKIQKLWAETNRSAHGGLKTQLNAGSDVLLLDLSPLVNGTIAELSTTKLGAVSSKLVLPEDVGKINFTGSAVAKVSKYYHLLTTATFIIVGVLLLAITLAVALSVEHIRTFRRILVGSGIQTLPIAILLQAPSVVRINVVSATEQAAGAAFVRVLFHDLQLALIIIGVSCIVLAIASKIWSMTHHTKVIDKPGQIVTVKELMKEEEHEKSLAI